MRRTLRTSLLGLLVLGLAACGGGSSTPGELNGTRVDPPFEVARGIELVGADGEPFVLEDETDKPLTLLFFGYSHCPDICGQVMSTLAGTMTRLSDADRERVDVVVVTTDPARDTPEVMGDYVAAYDPTFTGVTGELQDIVELGLSVGVGIEQGEKMPSGGYEVTHGTQILAVDGDDEVPVYWNESVSQAQLAQDVHLLLAEW